MIFQSLFFFSVWRKSPAENSYFDLFIYNETLQKKDNRWQRMVADDDLKEKLLVLEEKIWDEILWLA